MGLRFIRKPSDTPNITNADDARMVRYAYGGMDGYIRNRGTGLGHSAVGSLFRITSGVVVLQGYETEVDANGWTVTVASVPTKRYFSVWYEVNLAMQETYIKSTYDTAFYPPVAAGDNLESSLTGTARLLLYTFTATNGVIADVNKIVKAIGFANEIEGQVKSKLEAGTIKPKNAINADRAAADDNGDNIPNTYRKKSERTLFYSGKFETSSDGSAKVLTRNGAGTLTTTSFIEVEYYMYNATTRRQTIRLSGNLTDSRCWYHASLNRWFLQACSVLVEYQSAMELKFSNGCAVAVSPDGIDTGHAEYQSVRIDKVWIVE